jgi:hypothetical protein
LKIRNRSEKLLDSYGSLKNPSDYFKLRYSLGGEELFKRLSSIFATAVACLVLASSASAFVNFDQPTGSTCCFTSMSMVVTNLTGQRETPWDIYHQFSYDMTSGGASFSLDSDVARSYHLIIREYTSRGSLAAGFRAARQAIKDGGLAVIHVQYGHFTSARHCMVMWKLVHGNFRISDPNRRGKRGDSERPQGWSEQYLLGPGGVFRISVFQ